MHTVYIYLQKNSRCSSTRITRNQILKFNLIDSKFVSSFIQHGAQFSPDLPLPSYLETKLEIVRPIRVLTSKARVLKYLVIRLVWELSSIRDLALPIYSLDARLPSSRSVVSKLRYAWKILSENGLVTLWIGNLRLKRGWNFATLHSNDKIFQSMNEDCSAYANYI